jgi:hypothetical protein
MSKRLWAAKCSEKKAHDNKEEAEVHAAQLRRALGSRVRVYRCPFCETWHVGHVKRT